jgi:hypothetical protein
LKDYSVVTTNVVHQDLQFKTFQLIFFSKKNTGHVAAIRDHKHRLNRELTKYYPQFNFLTKRLDRKWNSLNEEIVNSKTVQWFEARLVRENVSGSNDFSSFVGESCGEIICCSYLYY